MDDAFREKLQCKLAEFREWSSGHTFTDCRLIHYCGVDLVGAKSLPPTGVEPEIEGLLSQGFNVHWAERQGWLYLRVWEFGGPEPEWTKVFAEEPLADIGELLRQARQDKLV
jgi:hypothetical protein